MTSERSISELERRIRMPSWGPIATAVLVAGVLWGGAPIAPAAEQTGDIRRDATVKAVQKALPSVVNIATESVSSQRDQFEQLLREFWDPFYERRSPESRYNLGSGVIIDEAGYILTNDHLVQRASRIWVKPVTNDKEYEAEPIARDPTTDLALLQIKEPNGATFQAIQFEAPENLLLGESVLALGNPFGLGGSVSRGILSAKNRRPPKERGSLDIEDWLQTDAAINPGNSGGPLINLHGRLIGLNVAIFREAEGIGFAIPVKRTQSSLSRMFTPETLSQLWFGAHIDATGPPFAVTEVESGSPAAKAGLEQGDAIVRFQGKPMDDYIALVQSLASVTPEEPVSLTIRRDNSEETVQLQLVSETSHFNAKFIRERIGATVQPLTPKLAEQFGLRSTGGLLVAAVDPETPADKVGLDTGFIIEAIDGRPVEEVTTAAKILNRHQGDRVVLQVLVQQERRRGYLYFRQRVKIPVTAEESS